MGRYWLALTWEVTYSVERWKQEGQIDDGLHVEKKDLGRCSASPSPWPYQQ
jgi:hypothetical protein